MRMRIIHITSYYPPHLGGMENGIKELAERTAEMGHEVSVYTSDRIGNGTKLISKENLHIQYLKSIEIGHTPIIPSLPFRLIANINKKTIVHIHYAIAYSSDVGTIISKIKNAKIVSHIHSDSMPIGPLGFLLPLYKKLFWKRLLALSDVIICQTEDYVDIVSKKYGVKRDKCEIVPSGVDTKKFKAHENTDSNEVTDILFVGRLSKEKNVPLLLSAFKLILNKYNLTLHIAGDGKERATIKNIVNREKIRNVILHGPVFDSELRELYLTSDVFILPSSLESFSTVILEAMASGLPVIASNISGLRNAVGDCGILVRPTPENFANAIIRLIEDGDLRKELISKGKDKAKQHDWDKITKKVLEVYENII